MHEFQSRELFREYAIDIPKGFVALNEQEAFRAAEELGCPVVIKAQVLSGGRGKAGGVKRASSPIEAQEASRQILSLVIAGYPVTRVLVVKALTIKQEYYTAITIDRNSKSVSCIVSAQGGIDIEETARQFPDKIVTLSFQHASQGTFNPEILDPVFGAHSLQASEIIARLYKLFCDKDLSLLEVNPLVLTYDNTLCAADAKVIVDDNALYKHKDLETLCNKEEYTHDELMAMQAHLTYISLDGSIGCMVNGAGLAMATMDIIKLHGGHAANFLDVGGSSNPEKVLSAFKILLANPKVKVILVNIFGGITRCDDIARGIIMAKTTLQIRIPLIIRITGTNEDEARRLLIQSDIVALTDMTIAVKQAVQHEGMVS